VQLPVLYHVLYVLRLNLASVRQQTGSPLIRFSILEDA